MRGILPLLILLNGMLVSSLSFDHLVQALKHEAPDFIKASIAQSAKTTQSQSKAPEGTSSTNAAINSNAATLTPLARKLSGRASPLASKKSNPVATTIDSKGKASKKIQNKAPAGPYFSKDLTLSLDYAARQQTCFYSAHFEIYSNGQKIKEVIPNDYDVHSLSFKLTANPGKNVLAFAGAGISDGRGATVSNIKLIRKSSFGLQDLLDNGDFKQGYNNSWKSHIYKNSIQGWKGKQIELGKGDFYNKNWNSQIIVTELDANQNTRIEQTLFFLDNYQVFYQVDPKELAA